MISRLTLTQSLIGENVGLLVVRAEVVTANTCCAIVIRSRQKDGIPGGLLGYPRAR